MLISMNHIIMFSQIMFRQHDGVSNTKGNHVHFSIMDSTNERIVGLDKNFIINGVNGGDRTHDTQDHNLVLYQLSYIHHAHEKIGLV